MYYDNETNNMYFVSRHKRRHPIKCGDNILSKLSLNTKFTCDKQLTYYDRTGKKNSKNSLKIHLLKT